MVRIAGSHSHKHTPCTHSSFSQGSIHTGLHFRLGSTPSLRRREISRSPVNQVVAGSGNGFTGRVVPGRHADVASIRVPESRIRGPRGNESLDLSNATRTASGRQRNKEKGSALEGRWTARLIGILESAACPGNLDPRSVRTICSYGLVGHNVRLTRGRSRVRTPV